MGIIMLRETSQTPCNFEAIPSTSTLQKKHLSKEKALMLMFLTKAVLVTMFALGLPAVIGIYALLLAKMIMGLKTIASTNAFTLGVLGTKYVLKKQNKAQKLQQVASLLPFYVPLMLSSLLSAASLISGAAGLIGSLIANSTNSTTNSTTTTTTTTTTTSRTTTTTQQGGEEGKLVEVYHLPMIEVDCEPNSRKRCRKVLLVNDHPPPSPTEGRFSSVTRRATQTVKDFWKRVSKTFKIS
nr:uncharacterized protein LOC115261065 [Aedes albopictus]